jgi:uncharacterized phage-like protein YoqJ
MFDGAGGLAPDVAARLDAEIRKAVSLGYKFFMAGGGLGFDMSASEAVISVKEDFPFIKLILALPCYGHDARWTRAQRARLKALAAAASDVIHVSESEYYEKCMLKRDEFLVDHASRLICGYAGIPGGTRATVLYAEKSYVDIVKIPMPPGIGNPSPGPKPPNPAASSTNPAF